MTGTSKYHYRYVKIVGQNLQLMVNLQLYSGLPFLKKQETSFCLHFQRSGAFLPDLQALRRKAKAKESAALEPTLAKPSTPLLTGRELGKKNRKDCQMVKN